MAILVGRATRLLVQGITGYQGTFHTGLMIQAGTQVVAGVTPGKGGTTVHGVPVVETVDEAVRVTGANASVIFVPARFARDAALEAIACQVDPVVIITEGVPVQDAIEIVAYAAQPVDQIYAITKAMIVNYDAYKDSAPGAGGLAADRQTKNWVVPVHPGAVKALKEAGQWSDAQEAYNNNLIRRQEVLGAAWVDYGKSSPPSDDKAFLAGWMKARAAALAKAGMPNGFED